MEAGEIDVRARPELMNYAGLIAGLETSQPVGLCSQLPKTDLP
jgi:hypothetical protein